MTAETLINEAKVWETQNRPQKAIEYLKKAYALNPSENTQITLEFTLANNWRTLGKYKAALTHYQNYLTLIQQKMPNTIDHAKAHFYLAGLYESIWRLDPACHHYQEATTIATKCLGPTDPNVHHLQKQFAIAKLHLQNHPKNQ